MADTRIADLAAGVTANGTDRIPVARSPFGSGDDRYITPAYIATYLAGTFDALGAAAAAVATAEAYTDSALSAHEAAADPHPGYLTAAEGNAAYQPLDADLTALAALAATGGMLARTGAGTFAVRTIVAGSGVITITNGDGVAGAPSIDIPDDAITYAKMQNVSATNRLLGRSTAGAGNVEEITVGGDITQAGSTFTIANDAVTFAKMQNSSAADVLLGRGNGSGAGDFQEITLGSGLSLAGTVLSATGGGGGEVTILDNQGSAVSCSASTSEEVLFTASIPDNQPGLNGIIQLIGQAIWSNDGAGDNKVYRVRLGGLTGTVIGTFTKNSSGGIGGTIFELFLINVNAHNAQIGRFRYDAAGTGGGQVSAAVDLAAGPIDLVVTGQKTVAGNTLTLSYCYAYMISNGA